MKPQDEARKGNDVDLMTLLTLAIACWVQKDPVLWNLGTAGSGKSWAMKMIAKIVGAVWTKSVNFTDQPPSTFGGLMAPIEGRDDLKRFSPSGHDVPLLTDYGLNRGIYNPEEIGNANTGTYNQFQDVIYPDSSVPKFKMDKDGNAILDDDLMPILESIEYEGPKLAGFDLTPNMMIYGTGNRPQDGAQSKVVAFPFLNRGLLVTQLPSIKTLLADLANAKEHRLDYLLAHLPFKIKDALTLRDRLDDPKGNGVANSTVYDWLAWEERTSGNKPMAPPESYRGQQACTGRSLKLAARAAMLPWPDYGSEAFGAMLRGYIGHTQGEKCQLYIESIMEEKKRVTAFKNGDHTQLRDDPSEQYRFCLAALEVLQAEPQVQEQTVNVALHNRDITGWFTHDLIGAINQGVGEWLFDRCNHKGINLAQCETACNFK